MIQEADLVRLRRPRYVADIPDALYMVEEKPRAMGTAGVDVLAAAFPGMTLNYYGFHKLKTDVMYINLVIIYSHTIAHKNTDFVMRK